MYKISFLDNKGLEFTGTTRHFTTDGRYNFNTINDIARDTKSKLLNSHEIYGYAIRKNSFNSEIIKTVTLN